MTTCDICPVCFSEVSIKQCPVFIPQFKEVILTVIECEECGYQTKTMKPIDISVPYSRTITLLCNSQEDLNREIFKSETATLKIPECELEMVPGTLGNKNSTIEGLLQAIYTDLKNNREYLKTINTNPAKKYLETLDKIKKYKNNELPFTISIEDPFSNSYIQSIGENDKIQVVDVERTAEQNEVTGTINI